MPATMAGQTTLANQTPCHREQAHSYIKLPYTRMLRLTLCHVGVSLLAMAEYQAILYYLDYLDYLDYLARHIRGKRAPTVPRQTGTDLFTVKCCK